MIILNSKSLGLLWFFPSTDAVSQALNTLGWLVEIAHVLTEGIRAKFAEVWDLFLLVLLDLFQSVAEAVWVDPFLARAIAPEHCFFRAAIGWVVGLHTEAVELFGVCEFILALWCHWNLSVFRSNKVDTFRRSINFPNQTWNLISELTAVLTYRNAHHP